MPVDDMVGNVGGGARAGNLPTAPNYTLRGVFKRCGLRPGAAMAARQEDASRSPSHSVDECRIDCIVDSACPGGLGGVHRLFVDGGRWRGESNREVREVRGGSWADEERERRRPEMRPLGEDAKIMARGRARWKGRRWRCSRRFARCKSRADVEEAETEVCPVAGLAYVGGP